MKATLPSKDIENGRNYGREKETVQTLNVVALKKGKFYEPVTARWYMGRANSASVVYCTVWLHGEGRHLSGKGSAGGGGYDKTSAAFQEALDSMGVKLFGSPYAGRDKENAKKQCSVSGVGSSAVDAAAEAMAQALGYRKFTLVRS